VGLLWLKFVGSATIECTFETSIFKIHNMMAARATTVVNDADNYTNEMAPLNHNFSMLLSPMEPSSSVATSTDTVPRQNFNQWHPESSEGFLYETNETAAAVEPKQQRWSLPTASNHGNAWSRSSFGAEGRETSQHSRGGRSHSTSNSGSQNSSSNYNPAGIWGNNTAFSNNDDFSKSSHTSTSTLLFNMASTTHEEDDLDDSSNFLHHDDIVESSQLFSSLQLRAAGFDSNDVAARNNQPPKQPVRRPSYGTSYNNSIGGMDFMPAFATNKGQDMNSSQAPYSRSSQTYGTSSLQQAAHANPYYPRSFVSSASTVPELVGASSGSVTTAVTSSSAFLPRDSSSSLALAASLAQYDSMYSGPPPPGFIDRPADFLPQRNQESRRSMKGAARPEVSQSTTLKDRNANVHPKSFSLACLNDAKDDMLSVTSTTTATTAASLQSYRHQFPQAAESSSSSYAVRALMENTTTSMAERASENRSSFLSLGGASVDVMPREPSPPILPQPMSEDYLLQIEREMDRDLQRQQALSSNSNLADNDVAASSFHSYGDDFGFLDDDNWSEGNSSAGSRGGASTEDRASGPTKKSDWLLRMNRKLSEIPVGELDPATVPVSAVMNAWAKTKSAQGAAMVELWLKRAQQEYDLGNRRFVPNTKMYTMAGKRFIELSLCLNQETLILPFCFCPVDAWARSGEGGAAAQRAEALLQHMHELYQSGGHDDLRPTNAIFNAVINAWARSREKIAPVRAEQILNWMQNLSDLDIQPDKYTFNTVIHAWAKAGGTEAATKAQELLARMHKLYQEGNAAAKPDTISYNVVINAWAKSGGKGASNEAEKLLLRMHRLHEMGDPDVKPNVVTYGAVIDSFAKSGERGAAARADTLLANMIQLHQSDPVKHADLLPNTYVFNTVINCWAKSKEHDAASKAEEMLVAMSRLHASGMPSLKPDNFTYTAVIDAWAKSGYRGAAARADQLLDKMEAKYLSGDADLKPNSYTYNAVICALAKSGEAGAAARAERVLQNMVNRHRAGGDDDIKPTVR
jgi:Pentatricopeptide repeat domain